MLSICWTPFWIHVWVGNVVWHQLVTKHWYNLLRKKLSRCLNVFVLSNLKNLDFCVHSNNLKAKPFFVVFIVQVFTIQVIQFELYGITTWHSPHIVLSFQGLTNDSHYRWDPTHLLHTFSFDCYLVAMFVVLCL